MPPSRSASFQPRFAATARRSLAARCAVGALLLIALSSCVDGRAPAGPVAPPAAAPPPAEPAAEAPPTPENARAAGVERGPEVASLGLSAESARRALAAFEASCPALTRRAEPSGLTRPGDWEAACAAAASWPAANALAFFAGRFETARIGDGSAFATGYFEPRIAGSRVRRPGYEVPVYGLPDDLIDADLGDFSDSLGGRRIRGRVEGRSFVPYYDRAAIEEGALAGRGLELAWAADPIDLFFLEIQGSGQLALPDGGTMRIGYAGQNGRGYVAIGRVMKERGLLSSGKTTMQDIVAWLRANPQEGRAIMRENKSFVFFRELEGPGPVGALGIAVTPRASLAADPKFVPLGAPVVLITDRPEANGLWVAQDTGGAIKGPNRFDSFWGAGEEAARIAGGMSAHGEALILLPAGTIDRIRAAAEDAQAAR